MRLISTEAFEALPQAELPWILEPFAVRGSTLLLYGRQGIGKSSLAWQLAHSLTTGTPWLGHTVIQTGPVVYLNLDMPHLEFRELLLRARTGAMPASDAIVVPDIGELDEFDTLGDSWERLRKACDTVKPLAMIVDTAADAFRPHPRSDINAEVRAVIARLRACVPHGLLVLLLHDRKRPAGSTFSESASDLDAFLGPSAWEAKATSSLRLLRSKNEVKLRVNKCRLDRVPSDSLILTPTEDGFFTAAPTLLQALYGWHGEAESLKDVFEAVARTCEANPDTVKRAYYRAVRRGIKFRWAGDGDRVTVTKAPPTMSLGNSLGDKGLTE